MKSKYLRRGIALLLSLLTVVSIMSVPLTVSARYTDEDIENKISYHEFNCREDDCDCLEPENDRFAVVSPSSKENTHSDYILVDTYENVQKYFNEQGWTDGLPIVPPTWIKAEKFMRYTPYSDNDVVATVNGRSVTAYQVAVNAIMSGCSAEYLPVCIAFVEALGDEAYLDSLRSGQLTPMMYVNGPIARQLGIDNGQGMTTEECNIAIARFMELALINLAGLERTNAFGNVQPLVFSEDEQNCINIGWDPHHVEAGFELNDNVITATSFSMWGNNVTPATDLPEEIMKVLAWDITEKNLGGLGGASVEDNAETQRTILITPSVAQALAKKYKSKDALENALVENARRPLWMRTYAYYYANIGGALSKSFSDVYDELKEAASEDAKLTASPAWMNGITYSNIDTVATMTKGNTNILIQGDESRNKTQVMPGGVSVSKEIQLDDTWDGLLESMVISIVYQPLSAHYITPVDNTVKLPDADGIPAEIQVTKQTTYTVAASVNYAKSKNRIFYDASSKTLYYGDGTTANTVVLDTEKYADFIALVEAIGRNSTIKLNNKNEITEVALAFKTNANFTDQNFVNYTDDAFTSATLIVEAVSTTQSSSLDGAFMTMSADLTKFTANLGGDIVMGDSTNADFVKVDGTTVTVDASVEAGATAVIGAADGNGTYKTMTIVNGGDGTYKITYNSANTLTLTSSSYYLKGTFNNWEATDAFVKTDNDDIFTVIKEIPAGTYTFKIHNVGSDTWYGNGGTISDTANRWTMDSSDNCTLVASGGKYEFKYEASTNKLSVFAAQSDAVEIPTSKTVYVGVIEYITDFVPTLHYWNNSINLAGDATLTATGETAQYAVGSAYWENAKQTFNIYKTTIPNNATNMKTFRSSANDRWAAEEVAYAENQILLVFEWGGTYHNIVGAYTPVVPCEHTNVEILKAVAATCTETGLTEGKKCADCGEILTAQKVVAANGHTEETVAGKAATCTEDGLTDGKKCTVCGEVTVKQTVIPASHTEETVKGTPATCTEAGLTDGKKCTVCGEVTVKQTEIPALGHTEETIAGKDATCTEAGLTEGKKCTVCGEVTVKQTEIPALGHTEETIAGKDATCTEAGLTEGKKCTVCGEVTVKQTEIPALGHTEETIAGKDATCTEAGLTEGKKCTVCGEVTVKQTEIPAKGHKWDNGTCTNCGEACEHKFTDGVCSICKMVCEHNWVDKTCEVCGMIQQISEVKGYSISLGGNIAVNFYLELSDAALADENAKVVFTLPDRSTVSRKVKDATVDDKGRYVFTCEVAAKEMASDIKGKVVAKGDTTGTFSYSVKSYAEYIINSNEAEYVNAKPLAKAMLNYGASAQAYFGFNSENPANAALSITDKIIADVDFTPYKYVIKDNDDSISYYGSRLSLESETAIKHYFYVEDEENIPEILVNGEKVSARKKGNLYEIKIADILAQNLDAPLTVQAGDLTLDYNAFSYGYLAMKTTDTELQTVVKALYAYNQAADEYLSVNG